MPERAYVYAVPYELVREVRLRRYGFHGTSHRYVAQRAARLLGREPGACNLITCHLGNGCSITAIRGGRSVDTSMGLTPLEGLVMGTRSGDIDAAVVAFLERVKGMPVAEVDQLLNKQSGLLGLSGVSNDMRALLQAEAEGNKRAALALDVYCYRIRKYLGAYTAPRAGRCGGRFPDPHPGRSHQRRAAHRTGHVRAGALILVPGGSVVAARPQWAEASRKRRRHACTSRWHERRKPSCFGGAAMRVMSKRGASRGMRTRAGRTAALGAALVVFGGASLARAEEPVAAETEADGAAEVFWLSAGTTLPLLAVGAGLPIGTYAIDPLENDNAALIAGLVLAGLSDFTPELGYYVDGRWRRGLMMWGLRQTAMLVGAALGAAVGGSLNPPCDPGEDLFGCAFDFTRPLWGVAIGVLIADAGFLAFELYDVQASVAEPECEPSAAAGVSPRIAVAPLVAPTERGTAGGLAVALQF
jgi:hypothetical protein